VKEKSVANWMAGWLFGWQDCLVEDLNKQLPMQHDWQHKIHTYRRQRLLQQQQTVCVFMEKTYSKQQHK